MTTGKDVLNHCLNVLGEDPVTSFDSSHPSAIAARVEIDKVNRQVQTKGYWFNKEYNLKLNPDSNGQVIIPSDTLSIEPLGVHANLVRRNGKLYDPINHTYIIEGTVTVDLTIELQIDDLPEPAAQYVQDRAAYHLYLNEDGDEGKLRRLDREQAEALAKFREADLKQLNVNSNNRMSVAVLRSRGYGNSYGGYSGNPLIPGGGR